MQGCTIDGVDNWPLAQSRTILDTFRGNLWDSATTNIEAINSVLYTELNRGPYVTISHENSRLVISTNNAFEDYEEYETSDSIAFTITFRCSDSSIRPFVFQIRITDTNNHDPVFRPLSYEFTIAPPIPPGFLISDCVNDITVRDIDLTTQRIDFEVSGSSLFEITFVNTSNVVKEFRAALRTTTLIRSISEPIILTVNATDVDTTGDPRRSTTATVKIVADSEFTFPDEPIFSQPFYIATYTDNEVILQDPITLRQGFDDQVLFTFEAQHSQYFQLVTNNNGVSFDMKSPIPVSLYSEGPLLLVVKAEREYTSGATATVVVQLPEVADLAFETGVYEGSIEDDKLKLEALKLAQGYQYTPITIDITSEYDSYFSTIIDGNTITLSMNPLSETIIQQNFINLQLAATNVLNSTGVTIVTLEIVKDDMTTPVFERSLYTGSYEEKAGLSLENIVLIQGYDSTVVTTLEGEHASLFGKLQDGPNITLTLTSLPAEILSERSILVSVRATKPRTVGVSTVVQITLPSARELSFEKFIYKGELEDNVIALETIVLDVGYDSDVVFNHTGEYADYFNLRITDNEVSLDVKGQLPEDVLENSFLVFVLSASGTNTITASATILLEIIKQDTFTPVFSQYTYQGEYTNSTYINFDEIGLIQGYDDTVTFDLDGEHAKYFSINWNKNSVMVTSKSVIPVDLIFSEKVLVFNVKAEKPRTVGANAAISLKFPQELTEPTILRFSQNTYSGLLQNGVLTMDNIVLESGFTSTTKFSLSGDSVKNFTMTNDENEITIKLSDTVSIEVLENYKYLILEIEATRERAVPVTSTLIIEVPDNTVILPVFTEPFYTGSLTKDGGLEFTEKIALQLGYDETVTFELEGDNAQWFTVTQDANSASLQLRAENPLPDEVFNSVNHLLFTIVAKKPDTIGGRAAISISIVKEIEEIVILQFESNNYVGRIEDGSLLLSDNIRILDVDISNVNLNLTGEHASYFTLSKESDYISINLREMPDNVDSNDLILLNLEASKTNAISGHTTIILNVVNNSDTNIVQPVFEQAYYIGEFSKQDGLNFSHTISLIQGFDTDVSFELTGDDSIWFRLSKVEENSFTLLVQDEEGLREITDRSHLVFSILANKHDTVGRTAVIISLQDVTETKQLAFSKDFYTGYIENGAITLGTITVNQESTNGINFTLIGDYFNYFQITKTNNTTITIEIVDDVLPMEIIEANNILVITLEANTGQIRAHTTIILEIKKDINISSILKFEHAYYKGSYSNTDGFVFESDINIISDSDESVLLSLEGNNSIWFSLTLNDNNSTTLALTEQIPENVLINNRNLVFSILAQKADLSARTAIIIELLPDNRNLTMLGFERRNYVGSLNNNTLKLESITIIEGYSENVKFAIDKEFTSYIGILQNDETVSLEIIKPIPENMIPENKIIVLELKASAPDSIAAFATIILEVTTNETPSIEELSFDKKYYTGHYYVTGILDFNETITLVAGYDESTKIELEGELAQWFDIQQTENTAIVKLKISVPDTILSEYQPLIFIVNAQKENSDWIARAVIIITHNYGSDSINVSFNKVLYNGNLKGGVVSHDTIQLSGFTGTNVIITGELSTSFEATVANGYVTVSVASAATFPESLTYIALTLHADSANAVLILDVLPLDPNLPTVSFSSQSYFFWADVKQVGSVGRVTATVDNGETVNYSITTDSDLQTRVSINAEGEILLSAPVGEGVHNMKVTATAQTSQVSATVPVLLRVDTLPECNSEDGLPPLIILQKVEEEPHLNLIVLNQTDNENCWYTVTSLWPEDQSWLYIENGGLHAKVIDREHKSIAFMILSQIQAELILHCDNDERTIVKRSLATGTESELDAYDYGSNKWILADTITYNARRSVVNLIIEDINDNPPIFVGKENEPIYVGYPIAELENTILPRALIELEATDADIGENAALLYWSREEKLAVAPTTGFVHVRNNALLENDSQFTVYATDQNGRGLNGSLDIVVKLLEKTQIAVITVRNSFLDDENAILGNLSTSVGYNIKILRTVIISENNENNETITRRKREVPTTTGASLQLFVYGILGSQLIDVSKLRSDLDQVVSVNTFRVESLEEHLDNIEVSPVPEQNTALFASTIALAAVLFILIVAATVWFLLKWRKKRNYDKFSDANSLASRIEPEPIPKVESLTKPRLDIEELKRSERRLQEMLHAPIPEIEVHPPKQEINRLEEQTMSSVKPNETLIDIAADPQQPIVIQSIDKLKADESEDDEFGEVEVTTPRKSVVTFNENVEKIIHLEYGIDDSSEPDTEVFRL
ncbi:protocadherin Fat 3-like [Bicyclus anynana]|uniref:Protocadherin Fat 3-like n=1 Tax=Bicyclus anynana TaxID=110368 RepID=A0ABM3LHR8_BICAN|nr:protocadherin Fat 3-like [Bicyclus anynana]